MTTSSSPPTTSRLRYRLVAVGGATKRLVNKFSRVAQRGQWAFRRCAKQSVNNISRSIKWAAAQVAYRTAQIACAGGFWVLVWWLLPIWWAYSLRCKVDPLALVDAV